MAYHEVIENATSYDELLAGPEIPVLTKNISLQKGAAYKRGMLITDVANITVEKDATAPTASAQTVKGGACDYIMKDDLDLTSAEADGVGTVYISGRFNREKIVLADEDTVEAHEAELRTKNIIFTSLKGLEA